MQGHLGLDFHYVGKPLDFQVTANASMAAGNVSVERGVGPHRQNDEIQSGVRRERSKFGEILFRPVASLPPGFFRNDRRRRNIDRGIEF